MQKSNPTLYEKKNKAILHTWKMHAFKLNITVDNSSDLWENAE